MTEAKIGAPARPVTTNPTALCFAMLLCAALAPVALPLPLALPATVLLGSGGLALLQRAAAGRWPRLLGMLLDAVVLGLLSLARSDAYRVWQVPDAFGDVLRLTNAGVAVTVLIYGFAAAAILMRAHRHIALTEALGVLLIPAAVQPDAAGRQHGADEPARLLADRRKRHRRRAAGRDRPVGDPRGLRRGADRRVARARRRPAARATRALHALLIGSAIHAALTPVVADVTVGTMAWGGAVQFVLGVATAALAQSGLWAMTFIVTGLAIDALSNRPPTFTTTWRHWTNGLTKGAIYGGVFMALLLAAGAVLQTPGLVGAITAVPWLAGIVLGALLFPLAATVVASADGTPPFFGRLAEAYRAPRAYLRGAVVGLGAALALTLGLRDADGGTRFLLMFGVGALAYAGVDWLADTGERLLGRRAVGETWRVYALGLVLGGLVGGALGWYFDAAQIVVVATKFWSYVALGGHPPSPYLVYPLFNKWGTIDVGQTGGGVRLFYNESLSGVINWSIAAPLFSINYFVLAALMDRSLSPLKQLISPKGFESLVEQAVRVLRWGLWMAPIINSFLRQSPDPSWYNQDGLVRSVAATAANLSLPPQDFRAWSLAIFTGLLAYDWLRHHHLVRPYGVARGDPRQPHIPGGRPDGRGGGALRRPCRAHPHHPHRHPALRDLGAPADPLLHPARARLGHRLDRSRADPRQDAADVDAGGQHRRGLWRRRRRAVRRGAGRRQPLGQAPPARQHRDRRPADRTGARRHPLQPVERLRRGVPLSRRARAPLDRRHDARRAPARHHQAHHRPAAVARAVLLHPRR